MGNSADRAWQLSQLVEGVSTAFNPSHGSLSYVQAGHCVSKQIGRHDAACQGCPQRVSQPAVLSALLVIQLFGIVIPPPISPKEHQKERCDHSRSQRPFITFHGALWNILLSADSFTVFSKIPSNLIFVNGAFE